MKRALSALLLSIKQHRPEAEDYGRVMLAYHELPADQKWEANQERQELYQRNAMEQSLSARPASVKQLAYLKALGCAQVPTSGLEASKLIEQFKK